MNPTDEQISAWLDGGLSEADTAAFETAMEADPALAERVLRWQNNDGLLKAALPDEPISDALLARLGLDAAPTASITSLAQAREARAHKAAEQASLLARWRWPATGALAASVAAALALWPQFGNDAPAGLAGSAAFQTAMQSAASSRSVALEDGREARPMLSFKAGDGRYCREFAVTGGQASESGIACRDMKRWTVEALVPGAATPQGGSEIRTAAGADGAALDATYARLNASDPLAADAEQALIAGQWQNRKK